MNAMCNACLSQHSCPPTSDRMGQPQTYFFSPIRVTDVTWNFEKFLIGSDGKPRFRFHPSVEPDEMTEWFQQLMGEKLAQEQPKQGW